MLATLSSPRFSIGYTYVMAVIFFIATYFVYYDIAGHEHPIAAAITIAALGLWYCYYSHQAINHHKLRLFSVSLTLFVGAISFYWIFDTNNQQMNDVAQFGLVATYANDLLREAVLEPNVKRIKSDHIQASALAAFAIVVAIVPMILAFVTNFKQSLGLTIKSILGFLLVAFIMPYIV